MSKNLQKFVQDHFFVLRKVSMSPDTPSYEDNAKLKSAFEDAGFEGAWNDLRPEMEKLVGAPIDAWHAGHLARLKGQTLPDWAKRDTYIEGFSKTQQLEELQRKAAETLADMKHALVREALTRHAQLYDAEVQAKMKVLLTELYEKSRKNPLIFLGHLANRQFLVTSFSNAPKPSALWSKSDKTTELVCQLANLTFLQIQTSLQDGNDLEEKNVPTSTVADISVR